MKRSIVIIIATFVNLINAGSISKRQAQISSDLDVTIGTQCVLNGRTFKSGSVFKTNKCINTYFMAYYLEFTDPLLSTIF